MNKTTQFRRFGKAGLAVILLLGVMSFVLCGCSSSPEDEAKQALSSELDQIKNGNFGENIDKYVDQYNLDPTELINTWTKDFSYEITNATMKDKELCDVEVKITSKKLNDAIITAMPDILTYSFTSGLSSSSSSQTELMEHITGTIVSALDKEEATTETVTVPMKLDGSTWTISDGGQKILSTVMFGDMDNLEDQIKQSMAQQLASALSSSSK